MDFLDKLKLRKKKEEKEAEGPPVSWFETSVSVSRRFQFEPTGHLSVELVGDTRQFYHRVFESFLNKFFPSGYPYSVNEGYFRFTQFRALQHIASSALSVLSTQEERFGWWSVDCLEIEIRETAEARSFDYLERFILASYSVLGLRPTPAQATAVSWILKDGMEHLGNLICSNLGARMDSEPKHWRVLADVLYDLGTGLEVLSPLCPFLFFEMAGLGNFAKGMAVVAARATRLPVYSAFAKEGNLSDLYAKGHAISTVFNVIGIGVGIQLASTICASMQGKLVVGPLLSMIHVYSVSEQMRATPVNTLNPQRTAMVVADFLKAGTVSSPADLRYREDLLFPGRLVEDAGNVRVGRALHKVFKPSRLLELKQVLPGEKFLLNRGNRCIDMVLEQDAIGEDALRGWLVAAYAVQIDKSSHELSASVMLQAYERMNEVFPVFLKELQNKGWHTDRFMDGTGSRFAL